MASPQLLVGLEVAKAHRAMARRPTGTRWTVPHDAPGIAARVTPLQGVSPPLIGREATGGLQRPVVAARTAAARPVVVVHPRPVRAGAQATGPCAHTAALAARALAPCAEAIRPAPRPVPDAQTEARRARRARRRPRGARRTAEPHRLGRASQRLQAESEAHIPWRKARLATLDDALDTARRARPV